MTGRIITAALISLGTISVIFAAFHLTNPHSSISPQGLPGLAALGILAILLGASEAITLARRRKRARRS